MAKFPGKLIVDLTVDGTVRLVFLPSSGDRNATPVTVEDLYAAEMLFLACGLMPDRAAMLRAELKQNRVASVDVSVDEEIAAKFRYTIPYT
jgi:hypothetical protein